MHHKNLKHFALVLALALFLALPAGCAEKQEEIPDAGFVQMGNPLVEVASAQEMEAKLGYKVPVLDKAVDTYIVLVVNGTAQQGRIRYADGASFDMKQGTGDVSGIYGGVTESTETISGVAVSFLRFEDTRYAIWEKDGFTFSLTGGDTLVQEVAALIGQ
jgi:hypothetical protein